MNNSDLAAFKVTKADLLEAIKTYEEGQELEWRPEEWAAIGGVGSQIKKLTDAGIEIVGFALNKELTGLLSLV